MKETTVAEHIDAERAAFEAWASLQNWIVDRNSFGEYRHGTARDGWDAWQAARRTPSASIGEHGLPEAAQGVKTWFDRAAEEYPGSNPKNWSAVFMTKVMLDEIKDLRTQLASAQQAKEYEQRHAVESEKALAQVQAQLVRQGQGHAVYQYRQKRDGCTWIECDATTEQIMRRSPVATAFEFRTLYAAPPLSSEQQANVAPCEMPGCSAVGPASSPVTLCAEHSPEFNEWRKRKAGEQRAEKGEK